MQRSPRLSETLKNQIMESIRTSSDFDQVAKLGVSRELLFSWVGRGKREDRGVFRRLSDEWERMRPFVEKAFRRDTLNIIVRFFEQLSEMAERDAGFRRILTIWLHSIGLNDARIPEEQRLEAAKRIREALGRPIHYRRWSIVEKEIGRLARQHGRAPQLELADQTLAAVFLAADDAKRLYNDRGVPDALTQIVEEAEELRRCVNDQLTDDYAGPSRRQKPKDKEWEREAPETVGSIDEHLMKMQALAERRRREDFLFDRLAILSRKTPNQIKREIERRAISDIKTLAKKLQVGRKRLYKRAIDPTREK